MHKSHKKQPPKKTHIPFQGFLDPLPQCKKKGKKKDDMV